MDQPFIADIRPWPHPVPPDAWLACDGSLVPIDQYDALFSLIGTTYGGDGTGTFGLPDLRGRLPMGQGGGPGLTFRQPGEALGAELTYLSVDHLPAHSHPVRVQPGPASSASPQQGYFADNPAGAYAPDSAGPTGKLAGDTLQPAGGGQPHANMPPFLAMSFIICAFGIYPSTS